MNGIADMGDGNSITIGADGLGTHTYAAAGTYTVVFSPLDGNAPVSTVVEAVVKSGYNLTISSNQENLNLNAWALANGWDGSTFAEITIDPNVYVWSSDISVPGLNVDGAWPGGVSLVNNGYIIGKGGNGADTIGSPAPQSGGPALSIATAISILNNGYIAGGGGGGGFAGGGGAGGGNGGASSGGGTGSGAAGGAVGAVGNNGQSGNNATGGDIGGGGGRILPGEGGGGNTGGGAGGGGAGHNGDYGQIDYGGVGGSANNPGSQSTGSGGIRAGGGGGWGAVGGLGGYFGYFDIPGGAGGPAVVSNGNAITWTAQGTVYGATV
jgi:hypothetical protein